MNIFDHFQHINLTNDQHHALEKLSIFLESNDDVFILNGYAGSGKTTLLKGFVNYLESIEKKYQLMAPTGRAAKVINQKTGFEATTIHKGIYNFEDLQEIKDQDEKGDVSFMYYYELRNNSDVGDSVLIIDEASMVSDVHNQGEFFRFGSGYLLKDLVKYSKIEIPDVKTKIIFIGDPAQLPPVGMNFSPAMSEKHLSENYNLRISSIEIKEVKRQDADNGILKSATKIRQCLTSGFFNNFDLRENKKDIFNPKFEDFLEIYKSQKGTKIIISYKNKTALELNQIIRKDKFGKDAVIQPSDKIIIGGNNYQLGIMNGEFGIVVNVETETITREIKFYKKDKGGVANISLTWRFIELLIPNEEEEYKIVKGYMLENYLNGDNYLKPEEQQALYIDFKNRNPKLKPKTNQFKEAIKTDSFFNCIILKYGYAITCHKSQGGEWDSTFVFWDIGTQKSFNYYEKEHTPNSKTNSGFFRWAYTAVTRASEHLFCINPPYFNSFSNMSFIDVNVQEAINDLTGKSTSTAEIHINDVLHELEEFGLSEASLPIQNHFCNIWYNLQQHDISIESWQRIGYEIRYILKREEQTAALKYWINGKDIFKPNFQKLPTQTNSDELFETVSKILKNSQEIIITRNDMNEILPQIEFDTVLEEEKPFLKNLFDHINLYLDSNLAISNIQHLNYRERYSFEKNGQTCVIDFEYNNKGFFGRVLPLEKKCNNHEIMKKIKLTINSLKNTNYVI